MGRELTAPSERLTAAAQLAAACLFEGENGRNLSAVDIGCDHAKLSIYLVQSGICKEVLACDINDGPVTKARENISKRKYLSEPLSKYIKVKQNDGLKGLESVPADRIFILGMGGELIADILESSGFVKNTSRKTAFVLQAMTSEYDLRKYLYDNGFKIVQEQLVKDKGRIYSLMLCVYDGIVRKGSMTYFAVGEYNINNKSELFSAYIERKIRIQNKIVHNLKKSGRECPEQEKLLLALQEIAKSC